jgi:L-ribulokinase
MDNGHAVSANNPERPTTNPERSGAGGDGPLPGSGGASGGGGGSVVDDACVVGVDYGTLSGRAVVVRVRDGAELGAAVHEYRHGVMDAVLAATGEPLPPDWALQDPEDYRDVLRNAVPQALASAGIDPSQVIGIGTDFTACTVLPVLADGTPLCQLPELAGRPHAYPKLWKHHAAQPQADRINALAHERREPWIARYGGKISSEWQFAKGLQLLEEDPLTYQQASRWIEAADWIIWQLAGVETRNACTAGYKGIWQDGHYPSREFLARLNPGFGTFAIDKLEHEVMPLGGRAGSLTAQAAEWTGLPEGIAVAVGNVDAHVTAPAAAAIAPGQMVMIMGTSTCHVMNAAKLAEVPGMCGVVDGGIVAGLWGYEAGQSAVGDIFAWFAEHATPPEYVDEAKRRGVSVHDVLSADAAAQPAGAHGLIALDWLNGNRSVLVDHHLSGAIVGLTLATRAPDIYRALVESTAFGTRVIIDAFGANGVPVTELVIAGGLTKNEFVLQIYADVTRRPLSVISSDQGPALGSAIHAAVAAGCYPDVPAAAAAMGGKHEAVYQPDPASADVYDRLYAEYVLLHDYFGRGGNEVMHRLRGVRDRVLAARSAAPAGDPPTTSPPGAGTPQANEGDPPAGGLPGAEAQASAAAPASPPSLAGADQDGRS